MIVLGKEILVEGGLVRIARLALDKYESFDEPVAMVEALRRAGERIDLFSFIQKLSEASPQYSYAREADNLAVLTISSFDHWWTQQINNKTRNMIRTAEKKGVTVREVPFDDALVRGISNVYNESPIRQGKRFWHYGKELECVRRENGTYLDRSIYIGAFVGDTLVGFARVLCDEQRGRAGLMQIVSMVSYRDKAPTNALIAQAVRSCAARSIPYLVYSNFSHGNRLRDSLSDFKHHNGFQRVELPRYYVPLTIAGRVALRLRLHHKVTDRIPESWLVHLRSIRTRWTMRHLVAACSPRTRPDALSAEKAAH